MVRSADPTPIASKWRLLSWWGGHSCLPSDAVLGGGFVALRIAWRSTSSRSRHLVSAPPKRDAVVMCRRARLAVHRRWRVSFRGFMGNARPKSVRSHVTLILATLLHMFTHAYGTML